MALSVTPDVPEERSACSTRVPRRASTARINQQMKMALDKVAFLPFGLLIDKWRWDVFSGKVAPADYNAAGGRSARSTRASRRRSRAPSDDFDPGAKYHVAASTPYVALLPRAHLPVPVPPRALQGGGLHGAARPVLDLRQQGGRARSSWRCSRWARASPGRTRWRRVGAGRKADAGADARVLRAAHGVARPTQNKGQTAAGDRPVDLRRDDEDASASRRSTSGTASGRGSSGSRHPRRGDGARAGHPRAAGGRRASSRARATGSTRRRDRRRASATTRPTRARTTSAGTATRSSRAGPSRRPRVFELPRVRDRRAAHACSSPRSTSPFGRHPVLRHAPELEVRRRPRARGAGPRDRRCTSRRSPRTTPSRPSWSATSTPSRRPTRSASCVA